MLCINMGKARRKKLTLKEQIHFIDVSRILILRKYSISLIPLPFGNGNLFFYLKKWESWIEQRCHRLYVALTSPDHRWSFPQSDLWVCCGSPVNTRCSTKVVLLLGRRRRRLINIKTTLVQRLVFAVRAGQCLCFYHVRLWTPMPCMIVFNNCL